MFYFPYVDLEFGSSPKTMPNMKKAYVTLGIPAEYHEWRRLLTYILLKIKEDAFTHLIKQIKENAFAHLIKQFKEYAFTHLIATIEPVSSKGEN